MKAVVLSSISFFVFFVSFARQIQRLSGSNNVSGKVIDAVLKQPVENATVFLVNDSSKKNRYSTITDKNGGFQLQRIPDGKYTAFVQCIGYADFSKEVDINSVLVLNDILLEKKSKTLAAVTVTASKQVVENQIDKIVYNVDKDVTSQGGVATDVLRKVPQVTVDVNGNVELLGNPSVRFLINGKPSTIFGNSVADALQSIPASQIQSIEVISSPGAKYDASGTGGIINIILKKNKSQGFSGTVNATAGTRLENGSLNLNYKKNNISFNSYFNGSAQLKVNTITQLTRNSIDTATMNTYFLQQKGNSYFTRSAYRAGMGMDWDITARDNFSLSVGYNHFGNSNDGFSDQYNAENDKNGATLNDQSSIRSSNTTFNNNTLDINIDYRKKFKKAKEELSFSITHSRGNNNTSYQQLQKYEVNGSSFAGSSSKNPGKDHLTSIAIDYVVPLTKSILFETGVKLETEELISNANVYSYSPILQDYVFDYQQSYLSTFKRNVYAGYVSGSFQLFKVLNVIAGTRLEHTVNNAAYSNSGKAGIPDYNNFGPALTIAYPFFNQQLLKFSYAYRLERPEYRDLNPFVNLADPHNIITGNPYIKPEIGNDFQLGYSRSFAKENSINILLLYTYNNPDIKSYTTFYPVYKVGDSVYSNVNVSKRSNIASEIRWGLNISGSFTVAKKLSLRPGVQLYQRTVNNIYSVPQKITGFEYRTTLNVSYQCSKTLVAEIFGNYRSGINWQGRQAGFYSYSAAIRKQLLKGKASLGIVAVNVFGKYLTQNSAQYGVGFNTETRLQIPYRSFGINFMYKFGKLKINKPKEAENLLTKPPVESN